jgi:hypothetical protein
MRSLPGRDHLLYNIKNKYPFSSFVTHPATEEKENLTANINVKAFKKENFLLNLEESTVNYHRRRRWLGGEAQRAKILTRAG